MIMRLMNQTVTVIRRTKTGVDHLGNDVFSEVSEQVSGCQLQQRSTSEPGGNDRSQNSSMADLYAPPGADLDGVDAVMYEGAIYEVHGHPFLWTSPTGRISHIRVELERVTG